MIRVTSVLTATLAMVLLFHGSVRAGKILVGSISAAPGDSLKRVTIVLDNDIAYAGMELTLSFDATVLSLDSVGILPRLGTQSGTDVFQFLPGELAVVIFDEAGSELPGDSSDILDLFFSVAPAAPAGDYALAITDAEAADANLDLDSLTLIDGVVTVCLCVCHGDPACDGVVNVLDVVHAVDVGFRGQAEMIDLDCLLSRTDVDCSGFTNVIDVVKFVNVAFRGGDPALEFCDPCAP